jgi:hypothetical protein
VAKRIFGASFGGRFLTTRYLAVLIFQLSLESRPLLLSGTRNFGSLIALFLLTLALLPYIWLVSAVYVSKVVP